MGASPWWLLFFSGFLGIFRILMLEALRLKLGLSITSHESDDCSDDDDDDDDDDEVDDDEEEDDDHEEVVTAEKITVVAKRIARPVAAFSLNTCLLQQLAALLYILLWSATR
jgi:ABC-type Zn2+ transport system substrate-binding protein/surface adhesin